jgi:hypothetical protein
MNDTTTTDKCPHCGADNAGKETYEFRGKPAYIYKCRTSVSQAIPDLDGRSDLCLEREARQKAEAEVARLTELVEWYKSGIEGCWHAANTYDGNYTRACDNVMTIASAKLNHKINHTK